LDSLIHRITQLIKVPSINDMRLCMQLHETTSYCCNIQLSLMEPEKKQKL